MKASTSATLLGASHVSGNVSGRLLAANLELSFWGGVNQETGEVIDRFHPLNGVSLKDTILAIPGGRGSCGGSAVILELLLNGMGPRALVFERYDEIITLGVLVAEEFFGKTLPVMTLTAEDHARLRLWDGQTVYIGDNRVSNSNLDNVSATAETCKSDLRLSSVQLSEFDQELLNGVYGEAARASMRIIARAADMTGTRELVDVRQAHIDAAWFGPGSAAFAEKLRDLKAQFRIPTTLNAITIDQGRWQSLGVSKEHGQASEKLAKAYLGMEAKTSFTCAPYLLDSAPDLGDMVAWGESNAVIYANSVLGARTLKNANMLEGLIALTGRAPLSGVYIDANRRPSVWIRVPMLQDVDDAFWPVLGYCIGTIATYHIPVITGVEVLKPSRDDLKAFSAAFGTSSSVPMFHMVGCTREAPSLEAVCQKDNLPPATDLDVSGLKACWEEFNHGDLPQQVDLISLGSPHFSFKEMKKLAELCRGRTKHQDVAMMITCGRSEYGLAAQAGHVEELKAFGVEFLADTCWCFIRDPVIPLDARVIMTNSGKFAHYGPGLTNRRFCFGSLAMCVDTACTGKSTGDKPAWLQLTMTT